MPAPAGWNGRFLAEGNGGWAGTISIQTLVAPLLRGYAVATTDTGHTERDGSFALVEQQKKARSKSWLHA